MPSPDVDAPAHPPRPYRSTELDRAVASSRNVAVIGPVADLDVDRIAAVLRAAYTVIDESRLALVPRSDSRTWDHLIDREPHVEVFDADGADVGRLVTDVRGRAGDRAPLEVLVCGDLLIVDHSHGLGDGRLAPALMAAITGPTDPSAITALAASLPPSSVWTALRRHFATHPQRLADVLRARSANKGDPPSAGTRRITDWEAGKQTVYAHMDNGTVEQVRRWAAAAGPGQVSTASVTVALWSEALRSVGVALDDRIMILFDCRRYLGPDDTAAHGNFAVGIPLFLPPGTSPQEIRSRVRSVVETGWPVAILGLAELSSHRPRRSRADAEVKDAPGYVDVGTAARLSVSDVGRLTAFDHANWTGERDPLFGAFIEPDGPDAIALLAAELAGGRMFSASFCGRFIDPTVVDEALTRMCADPLSLLSAAGGTP